MQLPSAMRPPAARPPPHLHMAVVMRDAMPMGDTAMTQPTILPMASLNTCTSDTMGAAWGPMADSAAPISSEAVMTCRRGGGRGHRARGQDGHMEDCVTEMKDRARGTRREGRKGVKEGRWSAGWGWRCQGSQG